IWSMTLCLLLVLPALSFTLPHWSIADLPVDSADSPTITTKPSTPHSNSLAERRESDPPTPSPFPEATVIDDLDEQLDSIADSTLPPSVLANEVKPSPRSATAPLQALNPARPSVVPERKSRIDWTSVVGLTWLGVVLLQLAAI